VDEVMCMPDVYATITEVDPAAVEQVASPTVSLRSDTTLTADTASG
jgi:hypothetical protein